MGTLGNETLLFGHFSTTQCPLALSSVLYSSLPRSLYAPPERSANLWYSPSLREIRLWVIIPSKKNSMNSVFIFNTCTLATRNIIKHCGLRALIPKQSCNLSSHPHSSSIQFLTFKYFYQTGTSWASSWYFILFFYFPFLRLIQRCTISPLSSWSFWQFPSAAYSLSINVMRMAPFLLTSVCEENKQRLLCAPNSAARRTCFPMAAPARRWLGWRQGLDLKLPEYIFSHNLHETNSSLRTHPREPDWWPCCCVSGPSAFARRRMHSFWGDLAPAHPQPWRCAPPSSREEQRWPDMAGDPVVFVRCCSHEWIVIFPSIFFLKNVHNKTSRWFMRYDIFMFSASNFHWFMLFPDWYFCCRCCAKDKRWLENITYALVACSNIGATWAIRDLKIKPNYKLYMR